MKLTTIAEVQNEFSCACTPPKAQGQTSCVRVQIHVSNIDNIAVIQRRIVSPIGSSSLLDRAH